MATEAQKAAQREYRRREKEAGRFKRVTVEFNGAKGAQAFAKLQQAAKAEGITPGAYLRRLLCKAIG